MSEQVGILLWEVGNVGTRSGLFIVGDRETSWSMQREHPCGSRLEK